MKRITFTKSVTLVAVFTLFTLSISAQVGIGTTSPDNDLDVVGHAQISRYLKVGDPTTPVMGAHVDDVLLYHIDFSSTQRWNVVSVRCAATDPVQWWGGIDHIRYDNLGARSWQALTSPHIWLPANILGSTVRVEIDHASSTEDSFDGTYLDWDHSNNNTFNRIINWASNGYNESIDGTNTFGCITNMNLDGWDDDMDGNEDGLTTVTSVSNELTGASAASWARFRIVGMEDSSNATGEYRAYDFKVYGSDMVFSAAAGFKDGDIYAEGSVFAHSNSQIGDVAEFFPIKEETNPGDLVSMDDKGSNLCSLSTKETADLVIGVHSSTPSLFLNNPNEGKPIAISGRAPVNVCDENGMIKPGDYLTASSRPGFAMKAAEPCFVLGRAMETLIEEEGQVICMLGSAWYNPNPKSEGLAFGASKIAKGRKEIRVIDERISKYSRVFVTMKGNPKTNYWISGVQDGSFMLLFNSRSANNVAFDYLINNAATKKDIEDTIHNDILTKKEEVSSQEACSTCPETSYYLDGKGGRIKRITVSDNPPSAPSDVNKVWTWDSVEGFKEMDCEYNRLVDKRRAEKK